MLGKLGEALALLVVVLYPVGIAPIFVALTHFEDVKTKQRIARNACIISGFLLTFFAFLGDYVFTVLKVSPPAFRIAGGVMLFLIAIDLVMAQHSIVSSLGKSGAEDSSHRDVTVFPMAMPLIAGPGAITTIIILMRDAQGNIPMKLGLVGVIAVGMFITYLCLRAASAIDRFIGITGEAILERIFGILLAAMSVEFVLSGVTQILSS